MFESTELQQIPLGRLVACRVVRGFNLGAEGSAYVGTVHHLNPLVALQLSQEGNVKVERNKQGKAITVEDPAYLPPPPEPTAKVRLRIPNQHIKPAGEDAPRHFDLGAVIVVSERDAVILCSGGNPAAERVA